MSSQFHQGAKNDSKTNNSKGLRPIFTYIPPVKRRSLTHDMPNSPSRTQNGSPKKGNSDLSNASGGGGETAPNPLTHHNIVFLFIPNLIGYTRVLLAASSLYFMRWHPKYCTWLYIVSCLLDAFDGMAARRFGQSMYSQHHILFFDLTDILFS